jgi:membrane protease YdiL (CAAX protease family)
VSVSPPPPPPPPRPDREGDDGDLIGRGSGGTIPATWNPLQAIPVFILAVVAAAIVTIPFEALGSRSARYIIAVFLGELGFGVTVLFWVRVVNHAPLAALGRPRRPLRDLAVGAGAGLLLILAGYLSLAIVHQIATSILGHEPSQPEQVATYVRGWGLYLLGPVVIVAAPFGEELLFRGYFYKGLRRYFSVGPAAILSGIAFGAVHFAGVSFLILVPSLAVVGIGLALVYERRQSLLASMTAHAMFNLVGFISIVLSRR